MSQRLILNSLKWSYLGQLGSKALQPIIFIILARILVPEDFGLMASAMLVVTFSQILWEAGLGKAVIQRHTDINEASNAAFILNILLGILISILIFVSAENIAVNIFNDLRIALILKVMIAQILIGSLASIHFSLLEKEMNFKNLFWIKIISMGGPAVLSIPIALYGFGYWALVIGSIFGQFLQTIILWYFVSWKPNFNMKANVTKDIATFGFWVTLSGLLGWLYLWLDSLVVAKFLGISELGLFRMGNQFASIVFIALFSAINPVLYSYLSRVFHKGINIKAKIQDILRFISIVSIPIAVIMFTFRDEVSGIIFDSEWNGIASVLGVMALMHGFSWIVGMNNEVYRAIGKPKIETIVNASLFLVYLIGYLISVQYGLEIFVWTRFGLSILALILHILLLHLVIKIHLMNTFGYILVITLLSFAVCSLVDLIILKDISNIWVRGFVGSSSAFFLIALIIFVIEKNRLIKKYLPQYFN